jgi:hypothetical protein
MIRVGLTSVTQMNNWSKVAEFNFLISLDNKVSASDITSNVTLLMKILNRGHSLEEEIGQLLWDVILLEIVTSFIVSPYFCDFI